MYYTKQYDVSDEVLCGPSVKDIKRHMASQTAAEAEHEGWHVDGYWGCVRSRSEAKPFIQTFECTVIISERNIDLRRKHIAKTVI